MVDVAGERVRLRPLTHADIEPLVAEREADPASFAPGGDEGRERLQRQIDRSPTLDDGGFLELAIEAEGRLIGDVQARAPHGAMPPGVCEIGILVFADARGKGYGREAVVLFTDYLFAEGLARVQASTTVENAAMRRVLERVGYRFEGLLRGYLPGDGDAREDSAMYGLTRDEWPASAGAGR